MRLLHANSGRPCNGPRPILRSLDMVAECPGVLPNATVARDDGHERGRFTQLLHRRQVHGIKRANGLHRERPADASEYGVGDADEVTATCEDLEPPGRRALIRLTEPSSAAAADDRTGRFCKREGRRDASASRADRRPGGRIMFQECSEQRARFHIVGDQREIRRGACATSGAATHLASFRATLRHGHYQSSLPPSQPGAGYPASLRVDLRSRVLAE